MNQLRIAICEDGKEEQINLISILDESNISITYTLFTSGEEFLKTYAVGDYDVLFMDIYLDGMTGIEVVAKIREIDAKIPIAFTTMSEDHALKSYQLKVNTYMLKPLEKRLVNEFLETSLDHRSNVPKLLINVKGKLLSFPFRDILYFEQNSNSLYIFFEDGKSLRAKYKISDIEAQVDKTLFYRSHVSFLVNLAQVKRINKELMAFEMKNGKYAYIRREDIIKAQKAFHAHHIAKQISLE